MGSLNFEFIRNQQPQLAELGAFAENYVHGDPVGAAGKLRVLAETMVDLLIARHGLDAPLGADLFERMTTNAFETTIPESAKAKLHALRKQGNKALHGELISTPTALWLLEEAHALAAWFHLSVNGGNLDEISPFRKPEPAKPAPDAALTRRLADQERRLAELLAEKQQLEADLKKKHAEETEVQATAARDRLTTTAKTLDLDERQTRFRLIDVELAAVGWNVGADGHSTPQVGQEVEVPHQPTDTGLGYADYVLWDDDGKPLAVVEAKRTIQHAEAGQTQAKLYADGLEVKYGTRPVIFYTNGVNIWIWDDAQNQPPRPLHGFYSRDSLRYLHFQRTEKLNLLTLMLNEEIAGRFYQVEAIKRVLERFSSNHRKALIVMATGTGKTRVAVSMTEALYRARWARRTLFLCDRRELRKQAAGVFQEHLPGEPPVIVNSRNAQDPGKRIYLATYPAMAKVYQSFDVGFFDLIIADESHRSIYRKYRQLFQYFDALQVGLTATPVSFINRNTFRIFGCNPGDPTAYYSFEDAITDSPPCLVPFEAQSYTTQFLRQGIKYQQMSEEQRTELEEQIEDAESIAFDAGSIDRQIFNRDTNRLILRNLMDNGIRGRDGTLPGKSILFARNHNHAVLLQNLFDEMYPQFAGRRCRVIDNYDPRADELIDEFKIPTSELVIAISVDMLDTGIDVPEVVNLVFAKPIGSYVKFWQMIGRGTRLCPDLFGPGQHKKCFRIFDHWGNFDFFDEGYTEAEPVRAKALPELLFEARLALSDAAILAQDANALDLAADLMLAQLNQLDERSVPIREHWRELRGVSDREVLRRFDATIRALLASTIAPLMQWIDINRHQPAYAFDRLIARAQVELLKGSATFEDLRGEIRNLVSKLPINLSQVNQHRELIRRITAGDFWEGVSVQDLEEARRDLRDVMRFADAGVRPDTTAPVVDVTEDLYLIETRYLKVAEVELPAYRARVDEVLTTLLHSNPVLQKIKAGKAVSDDDLRQLRELVLAQSQQSVDLDVWVKTLPETRRSLELAIRSIIGLDAEAVDRVFTGFVHTHPGLNAQQMGFLRLLKKHIAQHGSIELERLYEAPFTSIHSDGVDGVFADSRQVDDLLAVLTRFAKPDLTTGAPTE